jgi:DNA repair protein RecO (recombination protein O)
MNASARRSTAATPRRAPAMLAAFVMHQYDWSETSLIVDLFTREQGRLVVVAKGAKRAHSQLRAVLLPFQRIAVAVGRAQRSEPTEEHRADVQTLRSAEWAGGAVMPVGAALFSGFYLNELLMKLLARHDPHADLFDTYAQTLPALGGDMAQAALRAFELKLLQAVGLLPDLSLETLTLAPLEPDRPYRLVPEVGVTRAKGEAAMPGEALVAVQAALQHGSLPALQQACDLALPAWRLTLRTLLHYHLGTSVLRTRQLMLELQALQPAKPP